MVLDFLANIMRHCGIRMWKYWCKAIGTKAYDDDRKADRVAIIRTVWILLHVTTCLFIIVGNGRLLNFW
jgi:hypothetical protein